MIMMIFDLQNIKCLLVWCFVNNVAFIESKQQLVSVHSFTYLNSLTYKRASNSNYVN